MIKLAIFDLGNVLFNIDFNRTIRYWAEKTGEEEDDIRSRIKEEEVYRKFERGEIGEDEYFALLKDNLELDISTEEIVKGWNSTFGPVHHEN